MREPVEGGLIFALFLWRSSAQISARAHVDALSRAKCLCFGLCYVIVRTSWGSREYSKGGCVALSNSACPPLPELLQPFYRSVFLMPSPHASQSKGVIREKQFPGVHTNPVTRANAC